MGGIFLVSLCVSYENTSTSIVNNICSLLSSSFPASLHLPFPCLLSYSFGAISSPRLLIPAALPLISFPPFFFPAPLSFHPSFIFHYSSYFYPFLTSSSSFPSSPFLSSLSFPSTLHSLFLTLLLASFLYLTCFPFRWAQAVTRTRGRESCQTLRKLAAEESVLRGSVILVCAG